MTMFGKDDDPFKGGKEEKGPSCTGGEGQACAEARASMGLRGRCRHSKALPAHAKPPASPRDNDSWHGDVFSDGCCGKRKIPPQTDGAAKDAAPSQSVENSWGEFERVAVLSNYNRVRRHAHAIFQSKHGGSGESPFSRPWRVPKRDYAFWDVRRTDMASCNSMV